MRFRYNHWLNLILFLCMLYLHCGTRATWLCSCYDIEDIWPLIQKSNVFNITTRTKSSCRYWILAVLEGLDDWGPSNQSVQSVKHSNHSEAAEFPPLLDTCFAPEAISSFRVPAVCVLFVLVISLTEVNVSNVLLFRSFAKAAVAWPGEEDAPLFVSTLFSGILSQWPPWPLLPGILPVAKQTEGLKYLVFTTISNTHKSKGWALEPF